MICAIKHRLARLWAASLILVFVMCASGCETPFHQPGGYIRFNTTEPIGGHIGSIYVSTERHNNAECLSMDLWPVGGIGIGFIGARLNVFPLQMGFGALSYPPLYADSYTIIRTDSPKDAQTDEAGGQKEEENHAQDACDQGQ